MDKAPSIREAQGSDLPEILEVFRTSISEIANSVYTEEQIRVWLLTAQDEQRWLKNIDHQFFLVFESNQIDGFGSLEKNYVDFLYVRPGSARNGIGAQVLSELEDHALEAGEMELHTHASLIARPFFEKHGYRVVEPEVVERQGVHLRRFKMRKEL